MTFSNRGFLPLEAADDSKDETLQVCMVAKFITFKTININVAQSMLESAWNLVGKLSLSSLSQ